MVREARGLIANIPHSLSEYKADKRQRQENTQFSDFLTAVLSSNWSKLLKRGQTIFACPLLECSNQNLSLELH